MKRKPKWNGQERRERLFEDDRRKWNRKERRDPIPMLIWCPECVTRHIDKGEFATEPHHTHACQHCGNVFRVAIGPTVGVRFLPGFKNKEES